MDGIVTLITELGSFGLLLGLAGWIIYNYVKDEGSNNSKKEDFRKKIEELVNDIKLSVNKMNDKIENVEQKVLINTNSINSINERIAIINSNPCVDSRSSEHTKQFLDRIKLGPKLHKSLNTFRNRINADHIFIGSFHNGNESLTGIPYYKFDIIAERFRPDKVERDVEFAFMYKDADLLRHDLLPTEVVQRNTVKYIIDEKGDSELKYIDDIIYRRMLGRDIKQLAISLLRDPNGTPSGFVGCVRYDYEEIDIEELKSCGDELEQIYAANEELISKNENKK